jgi:hypothetical protein
MAPNVNPAIESSPSAYEYYLKESNFKSESGRQSDRYDD